MNRRCLIGQISVARFSCGFYRLLFRQQTSRLRFRDRISLGWFRRRRHYRHPRRGTSMFTCSAHCPRRCCACLLVIHSNSAWLDFCHTAAYGRRDRLGDGRGMSRSRTLAAPRPKPALLAFLASETMRHCNASRILQSSNSFCLLGRPRRRFLAAHCPLLWLAFFLSRLSVSEAVARLSDSCCVIDAPLRALASASAASLAGHWSACPHAR